MHLSQGRVLDCVSQASRTPPPHFASTPGPPPRLCTQIKWETSPPPLLHWFSCLTSPEAILHTVNNLHSKERDNMLSLFQVLKSSDQSDKLKGTRRERIVTSKIL
eukprot:374672-Amphidinium_carterae.1